MAKKSNKAAEIQTASDGTSLREAFQKYFDSYPNCEVLYITSDGTPFFEKQWAKEHQKTLDPTIEVSTVKR